MADKDIARSIMNLALWPIYGKFNIVSALKRAFVLMDRGYLTVDELIEIVKNEADYAKFKNKYSNAEYFAWFE